MNKKDIQFQLSIVHNKPSPIEPKRECGYRRVGVLYLVGSGFAKSCPNLPLQLEPCPICGFTIPFYRDFMWVSKTLIARLVEDYGDPWAIDPGCPICQPQSNYLERYGFMWVGRQFYTPKTFIEEAKEMGVCKAIKQIPKGLRLGETWVMLGHPEAIKEVDTSLKPEGHIITKPGIFYAFIPQRIELLIYESEADEENLERLRERGITPIVIPDEARKWHKPKKRRKRRRRIEELIGVE